MTRRDQVSLRASETQESEPTDKSEPDGQSSDMLRNVDLTLEAVGEALGF